MQKEMSKTNCSLYDNSQLLTEMQQLLICSPYFTQTTPKQNKKQINEYKLNDRDDSLAALQTDIDEGRMWRAVREEEDCRLVDDAYSRL